MDEAPVELIAPVQQIVNTRRRWDEWASGVAPAPVYDELIMQGRGDVTMLARYAQANVAEAYRLGRDMRIAHERSRALLLRGLDALHDAHRAIQVGTEAIDAAAEAAGGHDEAHVAARQAAELRTLQEAVQQALGYRQRAIDELAHALATAALEADPLNATQLAAARYEQGAQGVPPVVPT